MSAAYRLIFALTWMVLTLAPAVSARAAQEDSSSLASSSAEHGNLSEDRAKVARFVRDLLGPETPAEPTGKDPQPSRAAQNGASQ
jgi:hypothetical protein